MKINFRALIKPESVRLLSRFLPGLFVVLVVYLAIMLVADPQLTNESSRVDLSGSNNFDAKSSILPDGLSSSSANLSVSDSLKMVSTVNKAAPDDNLLLMGTILPGYAFFIDTQSKRKKLFKEGEKVFNSGTLISTETHSAQVDINGTVFTYKMVYVESQSALPVANSNIRHNYVPTSRKTFSRQNRRGNEDSIAKRTGVNEWELESRRVGEILNDINSVVSHARLSNYTEEEVTKGYRVSSIKPSGVFSNIGIKNGDVILNVNGYEVTSMTSMMRLFATLKVKGKMDIAIDLLRGGEARTLKYKML